MVERVLLSPSLLSLNSEDIFKKPSQDETVGLKSYGLPVCDIRYADKTATALQNLYDVKRILKKFMIITKKHIANINSHVKNEKI